MWMGLVGEPGQCAHVEVDPFVSGADGTAFCLRWTYTKSETWASAHLDLSSGGRTPDQVIWRCFSERRLRPITKIADKEQQVRQLADMIGEAQALASRTAEDGAAGIE